MASYCKAEREQLINEGGIDTFGHESECAKACDKKVGCRYFSYGLIAGSSSAYCYWKKTETANCTEGWSNSFLNFFGLQSMSD